MKYRALQGFRIRTNKGEVDISPGQTVLMQEEKAWTLLVSGRITPCEQTVDNFSQSLNADERYIYEEMAAIGEYDGGLSREEAERQAKVIYLTRYKRSR